MAWWQFWGRRSKAMKAEAVRSATLNLPGWDEVEPRDGMRVWRDADGDALTLAASAFRGPTDEDTPEAQRWCRDLAESCRGGLIEVRVETGMPGAVWLIYKRLLMPAYVFTGMLIVPEDEVTQVWTVVSGERGTTGVREAIVTAELFQAGRLTIEDYQRSWAQDPYDASYVGKDRRVIRFMSDDECYDAQFPDHPLSKVRRVLAALPQAVQTAAARNT